MKYSIQNDLPSFLSVVTLLFTIPTYADSSTDYKQLDRAAEIVKKCFVGKLNTDPQQGCIDSLAQLHEHCVINRRSYFVYRRSIKEIYKDAKYCSLVDNSFGYITLNRYFELDEQSCMKGYETPANRLRAFYENSQMLRQEEPFAYDFEKASCKNVKKYVQFCAYVDGDLKDNDKVSPQYLPPLTKYFEQKKVCAAIKTTNDPGYGISEVDNLLFTYVNQNEPDAYMKAIQTFRDKKKRTIASTTEGNADPCKNIRGIYSNLGCQKWENVTDDESIYYDLDDFRSRRLKKKTEGTSN